MSSTDIFMVTWVGAVKVFCKFRFKNQNAKLKGKIIFSKIDEDMSDASLLPTLACRAIRLVVQGPVRYGNYGAQLLFDGIYAGKAFKFEKADSVF